MPLLTEMIITFFQLLVLSVSLVNACFYELHTLLPDLSSVNFEFEDPVQLFGALRILREYPQEILVNYPIVEECLERVLTAFPTTRVQSRGVLDIVVSYNGILYPNGQVVCRCEMEELQPIKTFSDWKRAVKRPSCNSLPVEISRDSIIFGAVESFKKFKDVTKPGSFQLHYRNIEVKLEAGYDNGGPRAEFLSLFFNEIIYNSPYFSINPHGYVVLAPGKTSLNDLSVYEAFGFYLAKAVQNEVPINAKLSKIITEIIRLGKLHLYDPNIIKSWDLEFGNSLKALEQYDDEALSQFDFKDIFDFFLPHPCTQSNLKAFLNYKMLNFLQNFNSQLIMIGLGFIRACPPKVAFEIVDLNAHVLGEFKLSAQELIDAFKVTKSDSEHFVFKTFCNWLHSLDNNQLQGFFRYISGLQVLPAAGLGALFPKLTFVIANDEDSSRFPHANTCARIFSIPPYNNEEETLDKLKLLMGLIESGEAYGFGLA